MRVVSGQFRDSDLEREFLAFIANKVRQDSRLGLLVTATAVSMFAVSDYIFMGVSTQLYQLYAVRLCMVLSCLIMAFHLSKSAAFLRRPWLLSIAPLLVSIGVILILAIRPQAAHTQMTCAVIVLLGIYLLVPNPIVGIVATCAFLTVGMLLGAALWTELPLAALVPYGVLLLVANLVGYTTIRRLARLQRDQFSLLKNEERAKNRLIEEMTRREALELRLRAIAETDELTGLSSRRHFMSHAADALAATQAQGRAFSLCMIDIDHFKRINDAFGHDVGDRVLRTVADACRAALPQGEPLGRLGGEEFAAALPGAHKDEATRFAERLRLSIANLRFDDMSADLGPLRVTVTIGLSEVPPQETTLAPALKRADVALYAGKREGRDMVRRADHPDHAQRTAGALAPFSP